MLLAGLGETRQTGHLSVLLCLSDFKISLSFVDSNPEVRLQTDYIILVPGLLEGGSVRGAACWTETIRTKSVHACWISNSLPMNVSISTLR